MKDKIFALMKKVKVLFDTWKIVITIVSLLGVAGGSYMMSDDEVVVEDKPVEQTVIPLHEHKHEHPHQHPHQHEDYKAIEDRINQWHK